jgi:ferritin-like metal-binding protein YciE
MKNQDLHDLFMDELADMYNAEKQIVKALPKLIKLASLPELKEALQKHWNETENQVRRIEKIFHIMGVKPKEITCEGMEGILKEGDELTEGKSKSPALDAAIISASQKVEHYEIASYGTLRSFAKHLGLESQICDLLQDSLDEEGAADKKLTKLADGSFFSSGVNTEAAEFVGGQQKKAKAHK